MPGASEHDRVLTRVPDITGQETLLDSSRWLPAIAAGMRNTGRGAYSSCELVEAPEVVVDGQHIDVAKAGLGGVRADGCAY